MQSLHGHAGRGAAALLEVCPASCMLTVSQASAARPCCSCLLALPTLPAPPPALPPRAAASLAPTWPSWRRLRRRSAPPPWREPLSAQPQSGRLRRRQRRHPAQPRRSARLLPGTLSVGGGGAGEGSGRGCFCGSCGRCPLAALPGPLSAHHYLLAAQRCFSAHVSLPDTSPCADPAWLEQQLMQFCVQQQRAGHQPSLPTLGSFCIEQLGLQMKASCSVLRPCRLPKELCPGQHTCASRCALCCSHTPSVSLP